MMLIIRKAGRLKEDEKKCNESKLFCEMTIMPRLLFKNARGRYHDRLFLEAWHSILDPNAGNDHIALPEAHRVSMNYMVKRGSFALRYFKVVL